MYILGLNGPPGCGRDSIAREIAIILEAPPFDIPVYTMSLAKPLRQIGMQLLGLNQFSDQAYAEAKATPHDLFRVHHPISETMMGGPYRDTLRQFQIELAESFLRKTYGRDFFARKLKLDAGKLWKAHVLVMVPDVGFEEENKFFGSEADGYLLAQIERPGTDWSLDSRNYVDNEPFIRLLNNATLGWAAQQIIAKMTNLGWKLD